MKNGSLQLRVIVIVMVASFLACAAGNAELPDGARGFSGQVRGVVVSKGVKNSIQYKVARILRVWPGSKAENPESLAGHTVAVGPRWEKGEDGRWRQVPRHVAFMQRLKAGQEITLEIRNAEMSHFEILELSGEQREVAGGEGDKDGGEAAETELTGARMDELQAEIEQLHKKVKALQEELRNRGK